MKSKVIQIIKKIVFTNRCKICGSVIELDAQLCDDCANLKQIELPRCMLCGESKADCACKKHKNEYKQIVAPYYYEDTIISAVHNLKDNNMPFLAENMADAVCSCVQKELTDVEFDFITYVPLRKLRERRRGFNQSALIAQGVSKITGIPLKCLLKKVRYTGVQHHKSRRKRKSAVFGAFDVCDKYKSTLEGKNILLIDDVKTTGSTLNECAKMLKIYGAQSVYCAAFAITKTKK